MLRNPLLRRLAPISVIAFLPWLTGCISSRYEMSKPEKMGGPPALHLSAAAGELSAAVETVIVIHGPGSWKRNAYWDEYVVTLQNRGSTALTLEVATLEGLSGKVVPAGTEPWSLEKASRNAAERNYDLGRDVIVHLGGGVTFVTGSVIAGGSIAALAGANGWAAFGASAAAGLVAVPAFIGGSIYRNVSGRHEVEREFARRVLVLPRELAPGQPVQASFFFPITPGPRQLRLTAKTGGRDVTVSIDLAPLTRLHLLPPAGNERR